MDCTKWKAVEGEDEGVLAAWVFSSCEKQRIPGGLTDEVYQTLLQFPDLRHGPPQSPEAHGDDLHACRDTLSRPSFLENELGDGEDYPASRGVGDQDTQSPQVILVTGVDVQCKQYTHQHS